MRHRLDIAKRRLHANGFSQVYVWIEPPGVTVADEVYSDVDVAFAVVHGSLTVHTMDRPNGETEEPPLSWIGEAETNNNVLLVVPADRPYALQVGSGSEGCCYCIGERPKMEQMQ